MEGGFSLDRWLYGGRPFTRQVAMEGGFSLDRWLYGGRLFTRQVAIWREAFH